MKHEEIFTQSRLTVELPRSYARSMPDPIENHEVAQSASQPKSSAERSPEDVFKELLAKGDRTVQEQLQKIQEENAKAEKSTSGEERKEEDNDKAQDTDTKKDAADKTDAKLDLTESSPKASLFGAILKAVKGTIPDEKLVKRVDTFTKSYDSLKNANLNQLKEECQSWTPPEDKNDPTRVVYMVVQKYIADIVEERGEVPLSVFLQAVNEDRNINVADVLAKSTEGASTGIEKAMERLMVALDEKPVEEWSTHELAEELVEFTSAVKQDGGNELDRQVAKTVEDFVIDQAQEAGVSKEDFERTVGQVEEEHEDILITQSPVREAAAEAPSLENTDEDHVIDTKPAISHDTVHSFEPPMPEKLSVGNDPELARAMWRAYNRGKDLTPEQEAKASNGEMPMLMGGSALPKEETRPTHHVLPPAGKVVPLREGTQNIRADADDEDDEDETRPSNVIPFKKRNGDQDIDSEDEVIGNQAVYLGGPDDGTDLIHREETKAKIGKDGGDLEAFFKSKAYGAMGLLLDKAKGNAAQQQKIAELFTTGRGEALALKNQGKLEEAQKLTASLIDQMTKVYNELDEEQRMRIPEGDFESGRRGGRRGTPEAGDPRWLERNQFGQVNATSMNEFGFVIGLDQAKYATGGDRELIDENENFREENFMYWVQENFLNYHNADPDNPQRFFDLIKIDHPEMSGVVSINTIVNSSPDKYTKLKQVDREKTYNDDGTYKERDSQNNPVVYYKFVPLPGLHAYLTDFVWLVGSIRNASAEYVLQMSDDNKIGELIASVMKSNVLTKRSAGKENTMEAVATLTSNFRDWGNIPRVVAEIKDRTEKAGAPIVLNPDDIVLSADALEKLKNDATKSDEYKRKKTATDAYLAETEKIKATEQNIDVGDGVAVAYLIYYNIADYNYLDRKFGKETHLFKKEGMEAVLDRLAKVTTEEKDAAREGNDTERMVKIADYLARAALISEGKDTDEKIALAREWFKDWYYEDNEENREKGIVGNLKDKKAFMNMLNIFVPPQKNANQNDIANRLIQLVVGERLALHDPKAKPNTEDRLADIMNNSYNEFAMLIAQFMTPFTGAAAKNDTGVNAVNAAAKMRWIDFYKKKQGENTRAGGWGNLYNLGTIRSSYVDMMVGMPTVNRKSIIDVFEEKDEALRKNAPFVERNRISRQLLFNLNDAKQYGAAHTGNAIKIFHQEIEGKEIDFHKFIHVDPLTGHVSYKPDAMLDALQDAIIKPTRYAWSTNRVPFHYIVRIMEDNKAEPPVFRTGTQLEDMFNPKVLKVIEKTYITSNKNNARIPAYVRKNGFLNPDGTVRRYAVNKDGKFIDKNGDEIEVPSVKAPDPKEEPMKYKEWNEKMDKFHKQLVLDNSDEGQLDPVMATLWDDTSFRRCVVKGYLINRFAGQLFGHTSRHSPYEYLDYGLREDIIQGLARIPVDPEDHTGEFEDKHIGNYYFTSDDIKMLRNLSKNQLWRNIPLALGADLRNGLFAAFKAYFARIWKESTAGV